MSIEHSAVAKELAELLQSCPHCKSSLAGHEHCLVATCVAGEERAMLKFFEAITGHQWSSLVAFQTWVGSADNVEVHAIRCLGRDLSVAVLKTHLELFEPTKLLYLEPLPIEESAVLSATLTGIHWHPC